MAKGYNVSGLTAYVKENEDLLIKDLVFAPENGDTIANMAKQLGIKGTERLNYLAIDPVLQDGSECGFNASGNTDFSERDLTVVDIKAQDEFCDKVLIGKYHEYLVKTAANKDMSDMPFEGVIMGEVVKKINAKLEKEVWQGATSGTSLVDGLVTIAKGADAADTINVTFASGATAYDKAKAMIMAIPEQILDSAVIFVSPAVYRQLVLELVEKNLYHFAPNAEIEDKDIYFPATNVKIHKTAGLAGFNGMYATAYENMVYGTDLLSDSESVRAWYDDNTELFKYSVHFKAGVTTYFPDLVVLGE